MSSEVLSFVNPAGEELVLTDFAAGYLMPPGPLGRFLPPVAIDAARIPLQPGARVRHVTWLPRPVDIPLQIFGSTSTEVRNRLRDLFAAVDPNLGEGRLRFVGPDGQVREIRCRYSGGAEGDESGGNSLLTYQRVVLSFIASDPFCYPAAPQVVTMVLESSTPTFFPFFPLRLTSSEIFATTSAMNSGDFDAWPVWTITGPGSSPLIRNLTTGDLLDLTGVTLASGDRWTIDSRPGHKQVIDAAGVNRFGDLSNASVLFPLAPGANNLQVEMSAATTSSLVVLNYFEPYRSV